MVSMRAGNRCWQILTSRPRRAVNQQTRLQSFTVYLEDLEAQCSHIPLKERTQIRKVRPQKWRHKKRKHSIHTHFRKKKQKEICSASRKVWWLDNSRAQNPQRRSGISEQAPIRCRGTSSRRSMESVSNRNFTGDGEEFTKEPTAVAEAKRYSYRQSIRMWQALWRIIMESSNNYTLSIRHKRNCRTSCTSSKRRDISRIVAIWIGWYSVVGFYGMQLLSARGPRPPGRREISKWTKIWGILQGHALFAVSIWEEHILIAEDGE